jgi:hypothetical protein
MTTMIDLGAHPRVDDRRAASIMVLDHVPPPLADARWGTGGAAFETFIGEVRSISSTPTLSVTPQSWTDLNLRNEPNS